MVQNRSENGVEAGGLFGGAGADFGEVDAGGQAGAQHGTSVDIDINCPDTRGVRHVPR